MGIDSELLHTFLEHRFITCHFPPAQFLFGIPCMPAHVPTLCSLKSRLQYVIHFSLLILGYIVY